MAPNDELINQEEIERLLQQQAPVAPQAQPKPKPKPKPAADPPAGDAPDQKQIEKLLNNTGAASAPGAPAAATASAPTQPAAAGRPGEPPPEAKQLLAQDDIEKLISQAGKDAAPPPPPKPAAVKEKPAPIPLPGEGDVAQNDIELLLRQAEQALASVDAPPDGPPPGVAAFRFQELAGAPASSETTTLDLIRDVELDLKIELGRTHMYLEDVLRLRKGSVVPLDKLAGDPVDIYVNGRLIARGEVLVLNDNFCVRVAELIAGVNPLA